MKHITLDQLRRQFPNASKSTLQANVRDYGLEVADVGAIKKEMRRMRQDHKPLLNELEQRWFDKLKADYPGEDFLPQCLRLKLGNGIWYKPDIICFQHYCPEFEHSRFTAWEVKGPNAWRGGFENLKVAANQYPAVLFMMVWEDNGWNGQEVIP